MSAGVDHDLFSRLARSRDFLAAEQGSLRDAALVAAISRFHYLRLFRQTFGETPHQFVQRTRIELACHLLIATDRSVTDICFDTGYSSMGSFSALFHRRMGMTPVAYRQAMRRKIFAIRWAPVRPTVPCCFLAYYGEEPQF